MEKILETTPFITVKEVTTKVITINTEAVKAKVDSYLKDNAIAGDKYICEAVLVDGMNRVTLELERVGDEFGIDEDFTADDAFEAFCAEMKTALRCPRFDVPGYYYAK